MNPIEYAKRICYSSVETLNFTYEQAKNYANKEGVYVECGVAAGAQIIAMAYGAPSKTIYAFDSFEGIPLPSNRDDQYPGIKLISKEEQSALPNPGDQKLETTGATSVSEEDFWVHIKASGVNSKNIITRPGWFEDTTAGYPDNHHHLGKISILRLDGDLYNSTLVCLQNLYPKVIKGGLVIIDDWGLKGCREACEDYFEVSLALEGIKYISNIAYFYK